MKIRTISYRRVRNLGNYQTETVEIQGEIDDKEDPDAAFRQIKAKVFSWLGFSQPQEPDVTGTPQHEWED